MGLNSCGNILNGSEHGLTPSYHNHHAHNTGNANVISHNAYITMPM